MINPMETFEFPWAQYSRAKFNFESASGLINEMKRGLDELDDLLDRRRGEGTIEGAIRTIVELKKQLHQGPTCEIDVENL